MAEKLVPRTVYLDWLKGFRDKNVIKVVSGVRRCGKSTLLELFQAWLVDGGVEQSHIIALNFEDFGIRHLRDPKTLHDYILGQAVGNGSYYVFLDEIQAVKGFEEVAASLALRKNLDLYLTGSNAYLLSGELATLLSGRYVRLEMLPLSFVEFCDLAGEVVSIPAFLRYMQYGSFPGLGQLGTNTTLAASYLDGVYNSILLKDVALRLGSSDASILEAIAKFLFSNVGSPVSVKRITDTINSTGRAISINTVDKYLRALCDSYLFYKVDRYDIRGRQHLKTQGKYYTVDSGLREMNLRSSTPDVGHVLENIVFLELLRRGNRVSIGKLGDKEVDFVAEDVSDMAYFQVSATVLDENTRFRELEPLQKISDNRPKYLITMDEIPRSANYEGIKQVHIVDWLTAS